MRLNGKSLQKLAYFFRYLLFCVSFIDRTGYFSEREAAAFVQALERKQALSPPKKRGDSIMSPESSPRSSPTLEDGNMRPTMFASSVPGTVDSRLIMLILIFDRGES